MPEREPRLARNTFRIREHPGCSVVVKEDVAVDPFESSVPVDPKAWRANVPLFGRVRWSGPHALADVLDNLPRRFRVGFAAGLEDVDDGAAYRCRAPRRGF